MEITRRSKLLDVLKAYPFLEEQIIEIAPPFKNLRNPVLRRTVGQLATIEKVAQIGNLDVVELVNSLRRAAGQGEVAAERQRGDRSPDGSSRATRTGSAASRSSSSTARRCSARARCRCSTSTSCWASWPRSRYILLVTDFEPSPIIDAMRKQGRRVYHKHEPVAPGHYFTYIGTQATSLT